MSKKKADSNSTDAAAENTDSASTLSDKERVPALEKFLAETVPGVRPAPLIRQALIHRSYAFEHDLDCDNERLEFLGDALIGLVVSEELYRRFAAAHEGELSKLKARLVSRSMLGRKAREIGLGGLVLLGRGEEKSGGRHRLSLIGSALEAFIGALYIECGSEPACRFVREYLLNGIEQHEEGDDVTDYKSHLQELVQKQIQQVPVYRTVEESGPDHAKRFCVEVRVQERILGTGWGSRKKIAENEAARQALLVLKQRGESPAAP